MNTKKLIVAHIIGFAVMGCSTAIAAQLPQPRHMSLAVAFPDEPCVMPANRMKYAPDEPLARPKVDDIPKAAKAALVTGYAGAEFQLDATGTPRNAKIVCESPTGYGFGQALLDELKQEKFKPVPLYGHSSPLPDQWYYDSLMMEPTMERVKRKAAQ